MLPRVSLPRRTGLNQKAVIIAQSLEYSPAVCLARRLITGKDDHLSLRFCRICHPDRCIIAAQNPTQANGKRIMLNLLPAT